MYPESREISLVQRPTKTTTTTSTTITTTTAPPPPSPPPPPTPRDYYYYYYIWRFSLYIFRYLIPGHQSSNPACSNYLHYPASIIISFNYYTNDVCESSGNLHQTRGSLYRDCTFTQLLKSLSC